MPVRTLNYTHRKRIRRSDALISIRVEKGSAWFDPILNLADYKLPADARVFVEAYRKALYMRFDLGQVGAMRIPEDRRLDAFDSPEGVLFRVKVVTASDPHGLLLAEADRIRPRRSENVEEDKVPLLPVVPDDNLGDEIWRLDFGGQETHLLVNASLGDWKSIVRDDAFVALVFPAAIRQVFRRIAMEDEEWPDPEPRDDWRSRWMCLAVNLPGVGDPPSERDQDDIDEWIDSVAGAFCRRFGIRTTYERYSTGVRD